MIWPFENNTSGIIKKISKRNMKSDKNSKFFILLTIVISVCMVFSITLLSKGIEEEYKNTQRNKAQIGILGPTDEQLDVLNSKDDVEWIGEYFAIGNFFQEDKTITVAYGNRDYFLKQEGKHIQGELPQNINEIMLAQNYIDFLDKSYQVGDTISIDITGTGNKAKYTLSGIVDDTKESRGYFIYVSKGLAKTLSKDQFQLTAYTRLDTDLVNSNDILKFANSIIENTGIVNEQINLTEYFAVMSGSIKQGFPISVPILAGLTMLLATIIIYGIFYSKVVKNVQMFGQLRTIGMTKKQIKAMASKEGNRYAVMGIPLGLLVGAIIGYIGSPEGFMIKTTIFYAIIIAFVAFLAVKIAIFKPVRLAMNISPVEGAKYLSYTGNVKNTSKLHRSLISSNLAKINVDRNKKKAILTVLMLGISGGLLIFTSTLAGSISPEKQATFKYYPVGKILVQIKNTVGSTFKEDSESYGSSKLQLEKNPLFDNTLVAELEDIDGVEKISPFNCVNMTITFPSTAGSITSITDFFPTLKREEIEEKQKVLTSGIANYDKMVNNNGILVVDGTGKVGDKLKITGRSSDGSEFNVAAIVIGTYDRSSLMETSPTVPGSPYFIMAYDTAKKLTGITEQTGILSITTSDNEFDKVLDSVQKIADKNGEIEVNSIEQTINNIKLQYSSSIKGLYMSSAILFIFGTISLMNMLMVDFQNRKKEFGLLRAVGLTEKQLINMLNKEIRIYVAGSLVLSLLLGSAISFVVCEHLDSINHSITYKVPWFFIILLVGVLILIYLIFSAYAKSQLKKTNILSAIRDE
ncbi:ABC transporter permease [Streptococcus agalactiae]|uniref:ABC transporter permease n=1 Tax=Streptococcus agalactiae TaxID=1311 RepID=UPI002815474C|nr:ABC transporter permease [Streptococcus agalactiae]WMT94282.1 FtsX-like permease family protein [Streptococcus agalactiae]